MPCSKNLTYICLYCHKPCKTSQDVQTHQKLDRNCKAIWTWHLQQIRIWQYDPEDPDTHPHSDKPSRDWGNSLPEGNLEDYMLDIIPDTLVDSE
jgi:hypothetical protein